LSTNTYHRCYRRPTKSAPIDPDNFGLHNRHGVYGIGTAIACIRQCTTQLLIRKGFMPSIEGCAWYRKSSRSIWWRSHCVERLAEAPRGSRLHARQLSAHAVVGRRFVKSSEVDQCREAITKVVTVMARPDARA